jgi:hypothetical protein
MSEKVPKAMQAKFDEITALTDAVCTEHLNEEYADLARKLTAKLARKRPSPLTSGRANSWACGVVYVLGQVNFLFDSSQDPHLPATELCRLFGVASSTGSNKAKTIRDAVKMSRFDTEFMLGNMIDENPMVWMLEMNGVIFDARRAPLDIQVEAYQKGLIPYVPGVDMERLDALIKEHGYIRFQLVEMPDEENGDEQQH